MLSSHDIRRIFLDFFEARGHRRLPSSPLVPPRGSPVLFTVAGMQQMIPYFLGHEAAPAPRLTTVQKCFRTVDIDEVGNTRTLTFFEMLGNFSVGDYFKDVAIPFAYELLRDGFGLDPHDLWYTVHPMDDEAVDQWVRLGIRRERIVALEDNWWPSESAAQGPCGPDSEIFVDRGPKYGCGKPTCGPGCDDCERFLEIWNLVFMQYNRDQAGALHDLPRRNIDTGMGLERMAQIMQGVDSAYETDALQPALRAIASISGRRYGEAGQADRAMRIVADHARSASFLIADGVIPSNKERGSVLRRIIRRTVRSGKALGIGEPFMGKVAEVVIGELGPVYPELVERHDRIMAILAEEETRFSTTLAGGLRELERVIRETKARAGERVSGADLFRLYDSHGLPFEIAREVAAEEGLGVDEDAYNELLEGQRRRGQEIARAEKGTIAGDRASAAFDDLDPTIFLGYEGTEATGTVQRVVVDHERRERASDGATVLVALDQTPFYGLGGGQVPDLGALRGPSGAVQVTDVQRTAGGVLVHVGTVTEGSVGAGDEVVATVDGARRASIAKNHTATHLLHKALRQAFGDQVTQAGSVVAPDRLRFDFTYGAAPTAEELRAVEREINRRIQEDLPVTIAYRTLAEARAEGAMALFGEKYGDVVRTVSIDDYSKELCGGTHVPRTGVIGSFVFTSESGIGAGHRRVEALTGPAAVEAARAHRDAINRMADLLRTQPDSVVERLQALLEDHDALRRRVEQVERAMAKSIVDGLVARAERLGDIAFVGAEVPVPSVEMLREMSDWLRDRLGSAVSVLGTADGGRPAIVVSVTPDLVKAGWNAGALAREVGSAGGGSGGGRPHLAQAGVRDASRIPDGLARARQLVASGKPPSSDGRRA